MLTFPEHYFENEIRCNFHITAMMKRFWASQMEILKWIDDVCNRYGIRYIMCYGSLIGTVRHKGFIPWDDDLDIAMLRSDYEQFMEVVPNELPPLFDTVSLLPGAIPPKEMIFRINNGNHLDTSPEFLNRFHRCPYGAGVDLYVFDKIPDNPEEFAYQDRLIRMLDRMLMLQWNMDDHSATSEEGAEYHAILRTLKQELDASFTQEEPMTLQILRLLDLASGLCKDSLSHRVGNREQMLYYGDKGFLLEHFTDRILVPFEGVMDVPIPRDYDRLLRSIFGDYMTPRRFTSQHAYPAYRKQREQLYKAYEKRGWEIPEEFLEYDENGLRI